MSSNIVLDPVLNHFFTQFKANEHPIGICVGNMDNFSFGESFRIQGSYLVCAEKINMITKSIQAIGPGGDLIAGSEVKLQAREITLAGDEKESIQLVALKNLSIKAHDLKIQNVTVYLLDGASFSIDVANFSNIENVRISQVRMEGQSLIKEEIAYWKTREDLTSFMNRQDFLETREELLERLTWDRISTRKVGLRSILA